MALVFLSGALAVAQTGATRPLIQEKVNESALVALIGNTPPAAIAANDRGMVNPGMAMSRLILTLRRSPEQQAAFDAFVASQYDQSSPNFHHWLEPEEVGTKFGPALADIATVSSWLASHGLTVESVSKDRMTIHFSGTAAQVEETFHTEIHNLVVKGEPHISNMSDPQIPMALEPVVLGPKALHNFVPRPLHRLGGKVTLDKETGKWQRVATAEAGSTSPRADFGFSSCGGSSCLIEDVAPYDFAAIYNVLPLWNASTPIDGSGQTIAIAGRSDVRAADVTQFRSAFGLGSSSGTFHVINNGTDPGFCISTSSTALCTLDDQVENALDVEWSGAVAKGATVDLVVTAQTNTNDAIYESANYVIQHNTAKIINVSYGLCELGLGTSGNAAYNSLWQSAATQGIAVFTATGDSGSPACDQGAASQGPYGAQFGLSVSGIASSQYDTAVGGTDLNWGSTASPYWNATNSTTSGGATAKGYIPEVPWNDSCTNPIIVAIINNALKTSYSASQMCYLIATGQITSNSDPQGVLDLVNSIGAGGGASNCVTNGTTSTTTTLNPATCSGGYAKPTWQASVTGIPSDSARDIPDVSFFAGNGFDGSAYLICVSDAGACVTSASATAEPSGQEIGGTSVASPAMAGVMALINQKAGSAQGNPNAELYALAAKQTYSNCSTESVTAGSASCYFNDPDTGTNAMPCAAGTPNCTVATTGNTIGVLNGFAAGVGFDNATGLGSLNVANVVNGWGAAVTGTGTATVTVTPASNSIVSNQSLNVTIAVSGSSGTPTGTVTLSSGTYTSSATTLSSGDATITIPANSLAAGTDTLTATYSGDTTYATASGTGSETVTQATLLTPTVAVSASPSTFNSGQGTTVTVTVTGSGATPTGSIVLTSGTFTSAAHSLSGGTTTFSLSPGVLAVGTDTITAAYAGDSVYAAANGTTSVTITQSTYTLAATTPAAINRGSSATSTITWTTTNGYSSNVNLTSCTLNSGGPSNSTADTPTCSLSATAFGQSGSGTATVATKAATTAALSRPAFPGRGAALAGSGAILALTVLFGIPARRRAWRAMLGMVVMMLAFGALSACGGGGGSSGGGGGGSSDPGTASGSYTFTVKTTGTDPAATTATTTFTVKVN